MLSLGRFSHITVRMWGTKRTRDVPKLHSAASHNKSFISNPAFSWHTNAHLAKSAAASILSPADPSLCTVIEKVHSHKLHNLLPSTCSWCGKKKNSFTKEHLPARSISRLKKSKTDDMKQAPRVSQVQKNHICTEKLHLLNCKYEKTQTNCWVSEPWALCWPCFASSHEDCKLLGLSKLTSSKACHKHTSFNHTRSLKLKWNVQENRT